MNPVERLRAQLGDRYAIERELGRGGMGTVYLARDLRLDRPVALKVLPPEFAAQPALRERFLRETRMAAGFSHPNIVPVYAIEQGDDLLAYAMGFIEGESVAERVARAGPLGVRETARLLQDAGYALAYAHGRGVVHRDIKPENVMIERATGRALVMDFGIARTIQAPEAAAGLTRVGEVVGTPEYMSPEQATGDVVDGRSDLYSLGLTAYYALTGTVAMASATVGKVLARQITEVLPSVRDVRGDVPPALAEAIDRCLAKDPAARFDRAESLVEALDAAQLAEPEIPVPIRLFAQDAGTSSLLIVFVSLFAFAFVGPLMARHPGDLDAILPMLLLFGVLLTRLLQLMSEARRLAMSGFTVSTIERGMEAVVAERENRRVELRADDRTRRARRRTMVSALAQLAVAALLFRLALPFRTTNADGSHTTSTPGVVLIACAAILVGVGMVLLMRSPFRMPLGERLFRRIWIGPLGRAFLRLAARGTGASSRTGRTLPPAAPVTGAAGTTAARGSTITASASQEPITVPAVTAGADRLSALEQRVLELERWRRER